MTAAPVDAAHPPALDGEVAAMLRGMHETQVFGAGFDPVAFRVMFEQIAPGMWNPAALPVGALRDLTIPTPEGGIAARIYWPDAAKRPLPVLLFFHGGGFTSGSVNTADAHCRHFCRTAETIVVNADYRLAPEHPVPAGLEDALAATDWVAAHAAELGGDPARIAIGGDAPGATFATVCAITARDRGGPSLMFQLLLGPATDFVGVYPEKERNLAIGPVPAAAVAALEAAYLPDPAMRHDWRASPLLTPDLSGLPRTFILAAQYDFLRPEIDAYAARLRAAGTPVIQQTWPGTVHNFFSMCDQLEIARVAMRNAAEQLRIAFHDS